MGKKKRHLREKANLRRWLAANAGSCASGWTRGVVRGKSVGGGVVYLTADDAAIIQQLNTVRQKLDAAFEIPRSVTHTLCVSTSPLRDYGVQVR